MAKAAKPLNHCHLSPAVNPSIIFESADFEKALAGTVRSVFSNCGQVCLCSERVYVHRSHFERFTEALSAKAQALVLGDPQLRPQQCPLISKFIKKVPPILNRQGEGGTYILVGIVAPAGFEKALGPAHHCNSLQEMVAQKEENFGPFCHITPFDDEEEAIAMPTYRIRFGGRALD